MEVAKVGGFLPDVDRLEDAAVAVDHLADRVRDLDVHQVFQVVSGLPGLPFFRRNYLERDDQLKNKFISSISNQGQCYKTYYGRKKIVFVPSKSSQPDLTFVGKAGVYTIHYSPVMYGKWTYFVVS